MTGEWKTTSELRFPAHDVVRRAALYELGLGYRRPWWRRFLGRRR